MSSERIDLHDVYMEQLACGYDRDLLLPGYSAQSIASRLRSINAITAVLIAGDGQCADLGDWMRGGLLEAINALTEDATNILERVNNRVHKTDEGGTDGRA